MKIEPHPQNPPLPEPPILLILSRTLLIIIVLIGIFYIASKTLEDIASNYLHSHFQLPIPEAIKCRFDSRS